MLSPPPNALREFVSQQQEMPTGTDLSVPSDRAAGVRRLLPARAWTLWSVEMGVPCQAKSNRGPKGRKNDYADGERMIKRLVAQELTLSFVPEPEQRLWRTVTRRKL